MSARALAARPVPGSVLLAVLLASSLARAAAPATPPMPMTPAPDPSTISTKVLPLGDNRNLVVRTCAMCHPIDVVVARPRTQDEWDGLISRMVDHGAKATDDEQQLIFEYLVKNFGKPAK